MSRKIKRTKNVVIKLELDPVVAGLLATLADGNAETAVRVLIDHAQQGVYRPGAWEREWLCHAFGTEWIDGLEAGDPYGRHDCDLIFRKPKSK